jgi:hypothetical protein
MMDFLLKNKKNVTNKFRIILGFTLWSILALSCEDHYCDEILQELNSMECQENRCALDLKKVFKGNWDHLYIFDGFNTPEDISNAIGFEYKGGAIYDHTRLILQIVNGKLHKETKTTCIEINLDRVLKNGYYKKDREDSVITCNWLASGDPILWDTAR